MRTKMTPQLRFPEFTDKWQVKKLGDIAVKVSDRNNATSASTVLTNSAVHGVIPQTDFFDKEIAVQGNLSNYYKTELDDFVYNPRISTSAPVGPFKRNNYGSGVLSPLYNLYRFRGGQVLTFFEQYLKSIHWHKYMKDVANYGARSDRMAISSADLLALPLPYPSKPEQEKIADFLTAVDERIAVGEKKLELLETYKRGVMQKIFSQQIRFKDEDGKPYPDCEEKKLGEVSKIKTGDSDVQDAVADGEYPFFIRSKEVKRSNKYIYDGEAILIPGEGGIGEIFHYINGKFNYHQRVYKISDFDAKTHGKYVLYFIHQNFARQANKHSVKATVDSLRLPTFTDFSVSLPCKEEQQKIATLLTTLDDKITAEQSKLTKTHEWKKGLLQRMFV